MKELQEELALSFSRSFLTCRTPAGTQPRYVAFIVRGNNTIQGVVTCIHTWDQDQNSVKGVNEVIKLAMCNAKFGPGKKSIRPNHSWHPKLVQPDQNWSGSNQGLPNQFSGLVVKFRK